MGFWLLTMQRTLKNLGIAADPQSGCSLGAELAPHSGFGGTVHKVPVGSCWWHLMAVALRAVEELLVGRCLPGLPHSSTTRGGGAGGAACCSVLPALQELGAASGAVASREWRTKVKTSEGCASGRHVVAVFSCLTGRGVPHPFLCVIQHLLSTWCETFSLCRAAWSPHTRADRTDAGLAVAASAV